MWLGWGEGGGFDLARIRVMGDAVAIADMVPTVTTTGIDHHVAVTTNAILVAYSDAGVCRVQHLLRDLSRPTLTTIVTANACTRPSIAELSDGRIVVAYVEATPIPTLAFELFDATLSPLGIIRSIAQDGARTSLVPRHVALLPGDDGSFVAAWVGDGPAILYARIDVTGTMGTVRAVPLLGSTIDELATLRATRVGDAIALAWIASTGVNVGVVCDDGT